MIALDKTTANQFVFKEGSRITFKMYGRDKFIKTRIKQITDTLLTLQKNKSSEQINIPIDSIAEIRKIKISHICTRVIGVIGITIFLGSGVSTLTNDNPNDDDIIPGLVPPILLYSIPWLIPARVLYIGNKFKIEVRNE
jgi:hypothetical protein